MTNSYFYYNFLSRYYVVKSMRAIIQAHRNNFKNMLMIILNEYLTNDIQTMYITSYKNEQCGEIFV